jgi:hypothetical protein
VLDCRNALSSFEGKSVFFSFYSVEFVLNLVRPLIVDQVSYSIH